MPAKKRATVTYKPSDNRYDKPFRYLKKHDAYLVTLQTKATTHPELLDVVPGHGDRALPKGVVVRWHNIPKYRAFVYKPGYTGNVNQAIVLGDVDTLDEAVEAILAT
jgi:hypothetical protein